MRAFVILIIITFLAAYLIGGATYQGTNYVIHENPIQGPQVIFQPEQSNPLNNPNMTSATIIVPAVDQDGNGVATELIVQAIPGSGKSLVSIDKLFYLVDTQTSIRMARQVASHVLGEEFLGRDLIYTIRANASVIEGPSAGAALAIATIAAMRGDKLDRSVMITGTVNPDGTIGKVGGVLEKAQAAKAIGASMLLVPPTQSIEIINTPQQKCQETNLGELCGMANIRTEINISNAVKMPIHEVFDVNEAMEFFVVS